LADCLKRRLDLGGLSVALASDALLGLGEDVEVRVHRLEVGSSGYGFTSSTYRRGWYSMQDNAVYGIPLKQHCVSCSTYEAR
jgi:hypothetical protein